MFKIQCHCQNGHGTLTRKGHTSYTTYEEAALQVAIWRRVFPSIKLTIVPEIHTPEGEPDSFDNGRAHGRVLHGIEQR